MINRNSLGKSPLLRRLAALLGVAMVWELLSCVAGPELIPGCISVCGLLVNSMISDPILRSQGDAGGFFPHIAATLGSVLVGITAGIVLGSIGAVILSESSFAVQVATPIIGAFRAIPPLAFVPIELVVLSKTQYVVVGTVGVTAFLAILSYMLDLIRDIPEDLLSLGRVLGASRLRLILDVKLPAVATGIIGPLRGIVVLSVGVALVAEYLAAPSGLGRAMKFAMSFLRVDLIFVCIIWAVAIVVLIDCAVVAIGRRMTRWADCR